MLCILGMLGGHVGAYADSVPQFNLSMVSYRECASTLSHPAAVSVTLQGSHGPYLVPQPRSCSFGQQWPSAEQTTTIETTAWLRFGPERTGLRMVDLNLKMLIDQDPQARIRIRRDGISITLTFTATLR
jgi:hypothetical protein